MHSHIYDIHWEIINNSLLNTQLNWNVPNWKDGILLESSFRNITNAYQLHIQLNYSIYTINIITSNISGSFNFPNFIAFSSSQAIQFSFVSSQCPFSSFTVRDVDTLQTVLVRISIARRKHFAISVRISISQIPLDTHVHDYHDEQKDDDREQNGHLVEPEGGLHGPREVA